MLMSELYHTEHPEPVPGEQNYPAGDQPWIPDLLGTPASSVWMNILSSLQPL